MNENELERELERSYLWLSIALIPWISLPISLAVVLVCNGLF